MLGKRSEDMEESNEKDGVNTKKAQYLICEWCKIEFPDEVSMRQHLLGQKHKKLNDAEQERKRVEQKCGLFIRGKTIKYCCSASCFTASNNYYCVIQKLFLN